MNWYKQLSSSEKKLIKYGSTLISVVLLWLFVYKPVQTSLALKLKQKSTLEQQYQQMQNSQDAFQIQAINAIKTQRDLNQPFIAWIDNKLLENKLSEYVTRSEPKDNKTLILTFESVVFDDLIKWLQPLEQNFNITITEADVALTDRSNGLCNARITLVENS